MPRTGERVEVEASRSKRIQTIACHLQALYTPPTIHTSSIPSQWSPPGKPLVSGEDFRQRRDTPSSESSETRGNRRLIVGFESQLQPLPGRRRPCCPPLAQGRQEIGCRAQRRDGPQICQVGGALYLIRLELHPRTTCHTTPRTLRSIQRQQEHHH